MSEADHKPAPDGPIRHSVSIRGSAESPMAYGVQLDGRTLRGVLSASSEVGRDSLPVVTIRLRANVVNWVEATERNHAK